MKKETKTDRNGIEYDIEIHNLSKEYKIKGKDKTIKALDNVNLKVKKGEILGLLGPNGAGKTTMVSILTTLIQPTSGHAKILDHNILKNSWFIKRNVGLMLGRDMIYNRVTGYNNLKFWGKIYNIPDYEKRIYELAEYFDLSKWLPEYVENYSSGMKTKLAMMRVLLPDPKILFLDEPMIGLDPNIVNRLCNILVNLNKTIFLTSHQMNIVEKLCDRIAFLNKGRIIRIDEKNNFRNLISREIKIEIKIQNNEKDLLNVLREENFVYNIKINNKNISFSIKNQEYITRVFQILGNYQILYYKQFQPNLEDIFVHLSSS